MGSIFQDIPIGRQSRRVRCWQILQLCALRYSGRFVDSGGRPWQARTLRRLLGIRQAVGAGQVAASRGVGGAGQCQVDGVSVSAWSPPLPSVPRRPPSPGAIPWRWSRFLRGPGVDPQRSGEALERLCAEPDVQAVIAFGLRARGEARFDSDLDLAVIVGQPHPPPKPGPARGLLRAGCGGVPPIQPEFLRLQQIGVSNAPLLA